MNTLEQLQRQILELTLEKARHEERAARAVADREEIMLVAVRPTGLTSQAPEGYEIPAQDSDLWHCGRNITLRELPDEPELRTCGFAGCTETWIIAAHPWRRYCCREHSYAAGRELYPESRR